jgi:hypothetical protein
MRRTIVAVFDGEVLRPQEPVELQRDARYRITIEEPAAEAEPVHEPGVLDDLLEFSVETGIDDLAEQHDHYLYGTPKR